jgi:hypothetical protein
VSEAPSDLLSRRHFIRQLLATGALSLAGGSLLAAEASPGAPEPFRFAFLTDLHLMHDGSLRSPQGIAVCLNAVEKLTPRPDFILVGGDLVHRARDLTIPQAEAGLDFFLKIWRDHTALPVHWTFGNHDLAGTSNPVVSSADPLWGKGLFREKLNLPQLYYGFTHRGWRFVVLDDIAPQPDRTYIGEIAGEEIAFASADFDAHRAMPTIVCTHIPLASFLPIGLRLFKNASPGALVPKNLVCDNSGQLTGAFPGHDIRAVLCGHLHHLEELQIAGIPFINSGAVCGSYWKGPMYGCPEGFGVVDVTPDGKVAFNYQTYGWRA